MNVSCLCTYAPLYEHSFQLTFLGGFTIKEAGKVIMDKGVRKCNDNHTSF